MADLTKFYLSNAWLRGGWFKDNAQFLIDPDQNQPEKVKFEKEGVVGLPGKCDIVVD